MFYLLGFKALPEKQRHANMCGRISSCELPAREWQRFAKKKNCRIYPNLAKRWGLYHTCYQNHGAGSSVDCNYMQIGATPPSRKFSSKLKQRTPLPAAARGRQTPNQTNPDLQALPWQLYSHFFIFDASPSCVQYHSITLSPSTCHKRQVWTFQEFSAWAHSRFPQRRN